MTLNMLISKVEKIKSDLAEYEQMLSAGNNITLHARQATFKINWSTMPNNVQEQIRKTVLMILDEKRLQLSLKYNELKLDLPESLKRPS